MAGGREFPSLILLYLFHSFSTERSPPPLSRPTRYRVGRIETLRGLFNYISYVSLILDVSSIGRRSGIADALNMLERKAIAQRAGTHFESAFNRANVWGRFSRVGRSVGRSIDRVIARADTARQRPIKQYLAAIYVQLGGCERQMVEKKCLKVDPVRGWNSSASRNPLASWPGLPFVSFYTLGLMDRLISRKIVLLRDADDRRRIARGS